MGNCCNCQTEHATSNTKHDCRKDCFNYKNLNNTINIYADKKIIFQPLFEWTSKHLTILQSILSKKYYLSNDLISLLIKFIDKSTIYHESNDKIIKYPIYVSDIVYNTKLCSKWCKSKFIYEYKVLLLGDKNVGKRKILDSFYRNMEVHSVDNIDLTKYLNVLDLYGKDEYKLYNTFHQKWIKDSRIYLLIYSMDNRSSFELINKLYQQIEIENYDIRICILVCNKCDLNENQPADDCNDIVTFSEGKILSDKLNIPFIQTSAKNGVNIKLLFEIAVKQYWFDYVFANLLRC